MEPILVQTESPHLPERITERNLPRHLEGNESNEERDEEEPAVGDPAKEDQPDAQLDRALELLKSWNVFKTVVAQNRS
jgi:hypothetical protein